MEPEAVAEPALRLMGLRKRFGSTDAAAVDGIDLAVEPGELLTLLGPSGCGKTTTLNLIAGFLVPEAGSIQLAGRTVDALPPHRRDIGIVFQDYALFPHRTVAENIGFGLRMRGLPKAEIATRVAAVIQLVKLGGLEERRPLHLSGGQRQRVALARALIIRPRILLLDEPLSNLDQKLREEMRFEVAALQRKLGITTLLVTHDQGEALEMSDRVAVMNQGRIEQLGRPNTIYERPATRFVAEFIGNANRLNGRALADVAAGQPCPVHYADAVASIRTEAAITSGQKVVVMFRPERAGVSENPTSREDALCIPATVARHTYLGAAIGLHLSLATGESCVAEMLNDGKGAVPAAGARVYLTVAWSDCQVFAE
jgi:spermidine/putrescine ABC transporter ATP-binding subunit